MEASLPPLPVPDAVQQTLNTSFTIGGIGLHTGEYAIVRVRPAFAGDGRYFVRVPDGTNEDRFSDIEVREVADPTATPPLTADQEDAEVALFVGYLRDQENDGFAGSFDDWKRHREAMAAAASDETASSSSGGAAPSSSAAAFQPPRFQRAPYSPAEPEDVVPAPKFPQALPAVLQYVSPDTDYSLSLDNGTWRVESVELLLSALEACGVDNARIEIEGGDEIPVIDGSAQGWAMYVQTAGLRPAPAAAAGYGRGGGGGGDDLSTPKLQLFPKRPFTVQDGAAFISLVPAETVRLTCGVDEGSASAAIGKQWHSWCPFEDDHYRYDLAPARPVYSSIAACYEARDSEWRNPIFPNDHA